MSFPTASASTTNQWDYRPCLECKAVHHKSIYCGRRESACKFCSRTEHLSQDCDQIFKPRAHGDKPNQNSNERRPAAVAVPICDYCNTPGHSLINCDAMKSYVHLDDRQNAFKQSLMPFIPITSICVTTLCDVIDACAGLWPFETYNPHAEVFIRAYRSNDGFYILIRSAAETAFFRMILNKTWKGAQTFVDFETDYVIVGNLEIRSEDNVLLHENGSEPFISVAADLQLNTHRCTSVVVTKFQRCVNIDLNLEGDVENFDQQFL